MEKIDSLVSNEPKLNITDSDISLYLYCAITGVYSKTFQRLNIDPGSVRRRHTSREAILVVDSLAIKSLQTDRGLPKFQPNIDWG